MSVSPLSETDQEILRLSQDERSREAGFRLLMKTYQRRLYWHLRKMLIDHDDTDDVLQQTWIKVWNALPAFRGDAALYTWLYRIASNNALTFLNKKRKVLFIPIHNITPELEQKVAQNSTLSADAIERKLQLAILKLPDKQRLVFNMKYFEDITYEDMSEILGTSVGALKASYHHAVKKLEKYLEMPLN